jgi:hypothetical protein
MSSTSIVSYDIIEDLPISEIKLPVNQLRSQQDLDELTISIDQKATLPLLNLYNESMKSTSCLILRKSKKFQIKDRKIGH